MERETERAQPLPSFHALLVPVEPAPQDHTAPSLSLFDLLDELRRCWVTVVAVAVLVLVGTIGAALAMTPVYRASIVVSPRSHSSYDGVTRSLLSQLGGLAGLAAIVVGGTASTEAEAVAVLRSRELATDFIRDEGILPALFPDEWDAATRRQKVPASDHPTLADGYRVFDRRIRKVDHDRRSGLVTLTIDFGDPQLAAQWANGLVDRANSTMRARAVEEAQLTLRYLDAEIARVTQVPMRDALYQLVEAQQQALMVANTRVDFAFRVIDRATVPEPRDRIWPNRRLMAIGGAAVGIVLGLAFVLGRFLWRRARGVHGGRRAA